MIQKVLQVGVHNSFYYRTLFLVMNPLGLMVKFKEIPKPCLGKGFTDYLNGVWTGLVSAERSLRLGTNNYRTLSLTIMSDNYSYRTLLTCYFLF